MDTHLPHTERRPSAAADGLLEVESTDAPAHAELLDELRGRRTVIEE